MLLPSGEGGGREARGARAIICATGEGEGKKGSAEGASGGGVGGGGGDV